MSAMALFLAAWAVQSSAAIALGLLAGRLARRAGPAVQSAIYRTTLLVAILCPLSAWSLGAAGLPSPIADDCLPPSLAASGPSPGPGEDGGEGTPSPPATPIRAGVPAPPPLPVAGPAPSVPNPHPLPNPAASIALPPEPAGPARTWGELVDDFIPWMLACWLGGIAFFMARLARAQGQMGCIRRASVPAGPEAQALCRELAEEMGTRAPPVLCTPFLFSPCLDGLLRPAILIPDGERPDDLRDVLIHELAHRARRDGLWNLLGRLATAALWFQPLIWKLARQVAASAEEVCDDHVIHFGTDRNRYASLLLDLAGRRLPPLAPTGVGAMTYRSLLGRRVCRILDPARPASTKVGPRPLAATLAAGLLGILLAGWIGVSPAAICPAPDDAAGHASFTCPLIVSGLGGGCNSRRSSS